jgi:hypothetical protein
MADLAQERASSILTIPDNELEILKALTRGDVRYLPHRGIRDALVWIQPPDPVTSIFLRARRPKMFVGSSRH